MVWAAALLQRVVVPAERGCQLLRSMSRCAQLTAAQTRLPHAMVQFRHSHERSAFPIDVRDAPPPCRGRNHASARGVVATVTAQGHESGRPRCAARPLLRQLQTRA